MPRLIDQLENRIGLALQGLRGDEGSLRQNPVRFFSVRKRPDWRAGLLPLPAERSAGQRPHRMAPSGKAYSAFDSQSSSQDFSIARAARVREDAEVERRATEARRRALGEGYQGLDSYGPPPRGIFSSTSPIVKEFDQSLYDMSSLLRTIRYDPQYQLGLNIVLPQEGIFNAYPVQSDADYLVPMDRESYQYALDRTRRIASPNLLTSIPMSYTKPFNPQSDLKYLQRLQELRPLYYRMQDANYPLSQSLQALQAGRINGIEKSGTTLMGAGTDIAQYGKALHAGEYIPPGNYFMPGNPQLRFNTHWTPEGQPVVSSSLQNRLKRLLGLSVCADFSDIGDVPTENMRLAHAEKPYFWGLQSDSVGSRQKDWHEFGSVLQADPLRLEGLRRFPQQLGGSINNDPIMNFGSLEVTPYTITPEVRESLFGGDSPFAPGIGRMANGSASGEAGGGYRRGGLVNFSPYLNGRRIPLIEFFMGLSRPRKLFFKRSD